MRTGAAHTPFLPREAQPTWPRTQTVKFVSRTFSYFYFFYFLPLGRNLIRYASDNELVAFAYGIFLTGKIDWAIACLVYLVVRLFLSKIVVWIFLPYFLLNLVVRGVTEKYILIIDDSLISLMAVTMIVRVMAIRISLPVEVVMVNGKIDKN